MAVLSEPRGAARPWLHALRLTLAGLAAGIVAGAVAGFGARIAMFVVRLVSPDWDGVTTHAGAEVGIWTLDGTLGLVVEGAFLGLPAGVLYLLVRRWMPGSGWRRGLAFGGFLLVVGAPVVLDGNFEYFRYLSPRWTVPLFALLFPLYGVVVAPLTERWGAGASGPPRNRVVWLIGAIVLSAAGLAALVLQDVPLLRDVYHLW